MLHVERVRHVRDYVLCVAFDNGVTKEVDLRAELYGEVFEPLRDASIFGQVRVNPETGTIEWPNGADFAPEFLFEVGTPVEQVA